MELTKENYEDIIKQMQENKIKLNQKFSGNVQQTYELFLAANAESERSEKWAFVLKSHNTLTRLVKDAPNKTIEPKKFDFSKGESPNFNHDSERVKELKKNKYDWGYDKKIQVKRWRELKCDEGLLSETSEETDYKKKMILEHYKDNWHSFNYKTKQMEIIPKFSPANIEFIEGCYPDVPPPEGNGLYTQYQIKAVDYQFKKIAKDVSGFINHSNTIIKKTIENKKPVENPPEIKIQIEDLKIKEKERVALERKQYMEKYPQFDWGEYDHLYALAMEDHIYDYSPEFYIMEKELHALDYKQPIDLSGFSEQDIKDMMGLPDEL